MLIGREKERKVLEECYNLKEAYFFVLLGRKGIGKTYLVEKHFEGRLFFSCSAKQSDKESDSLLRFSKEIDPNSNYQDWPSAWYALKEKVESSKDIEKKVIFIDEFPWFAKSNFMSFFSNFWNGFASTREDILLIISGSAVTFLYDKVINATDGLYNRVDRLINLSPFSLGECKEYLESKNIHFSNQDILNGYNAFGGIPYYWNLIEEGDTISSAIDRLFFSSNILINEFDNLFIGLFAKPDTLKSVVELIATKDTGLTRLELLKELHQPDCGDFSRILKTLILCGYIKKFSSYPNSKNNSIYQLTDNYCYSFVKMSLSNNTNDKKDWNHFNQTDEYTQWQNHAFEITVYNHFNQIIDSLRLENMAPYFQNFINYSKHTDLIITNKSNIVMLLDIKYSEQKLSIDNKQRDQLLRRTNSIKYTIPKKKSVQRILISPFGVIRNDLYTLFDVYITLDDLMR